MKKFFSVFITTLLTIMLFATVCLGIVRKNISLPLLLDLFKDASLSSDTDIKTLGLYYPESNAARTVQYIPDTDAFNPSAFDVSSLSLDELNITALISQFSGNSEIDEEFLNLILEDEETIVFEDYVFSNLLDYMTGTTSEFSFDADTVETFVNKTIDKYESYSGETVDRTQIHDTVTDSIDVAASELTAALDETRQENSDLIEALKPVLMILKPATFYCGIGLCLLLALLILLINRNVAQWLTYIGFPGIISGLLLFTGALSAMALFPDSAALSTQSGIPASFASPILVLATRILIQIRAAGIVVCLSGIILLSAGCILQKKTNRLHS